MEAGPEVPWERMSIELRSGLVNCLFLEQVCNHRTSSALVQNIYVNSMPSETSSPQFLMIKSFLFAICGDDAVVCEWQVVTGSSSSAAIAFAS